MDKEAAFRQWVRVLNFARTGKAHGKATENMEAACWAGDRINALEIENQRLQEVVGLAVEFLNRCEGAMALRVLQATLEEEDDEG